MDMRRQREYSSTILPRLRTLDVRIRNLPNLLRPVHESGIVDCFRSLRSYSPPRRHNNERAPRTSTSRSSGGIFSKSPATCALSDTSNWIVANLPPCCSAAALCAAAQSAATFWSASVRRASSMRFAPPCRRFVSAVRVEWARTYLGEEHGSRLAYSLTACPICTLIRVCSRLRFPVHCKAVSLTGPGTYRTVLTALAPVMMTVLPSRREALKTDMADKRSSL